jgi:poly-beta-1,6-N-acetyl-D-glucosamine synthase
MSVVIWLCVALLVYTFAGYPLLIGALARLRPFRPRPTGSWEPSVAVCVAAHNAEQWIEAKLASILALEYPPAKLQVVLYSDGSSDRTVEMARQWAARHPNVQVLVGHERAGKPTALNRMHEASSAEVLFLTDVRQPLAVGALRALVEPLADSRVGCVSGNLVLRGAHGSGVYWRYEKWIRSQESAFRGMVGMTGSVCAMRSRDFSPLPADTILDDVWIPMQTRLRGGGRTVFASGAVAYDEAFPDAREFSRKARTLAGNCQLFARMPALLVPLRNPLWFETISHRFFRLLCPWALAVLLLACTAVAVRGSTTAGRVGAILLAGQLAAYALAALGARAGAIGSATRSFVVLNAAALVGAWRFFSGRQRITW